MHLHRMHALSSTVEIAHPTLDDPDETGLTEVPCEGDLGPHTVPDGDLVVEHRAEIGPPVLLPTVAVGAGRLLGVELEHGDELAVVRDADGDPDPPHGPR